MMGATVTLLRSGRRFEVTKHGDSTMQSGNSQRTSGNGFGSGPHSDGGTAMAEAGTAAAVAREQSELAGAIEAARLAPRNEAACYCRIIASCRRPGFAEVARYSFPRGDARIEGPSIDLAREIARCWGNMRCGIRIVSQDDEMVHVKGFAHDTETNNCAEYEDKFRKLIQRKRDGKTVWIEPDERDLRELVNRRGAICLRNAILQLIPPDIVADAMATAKETMTAAAAGEVKQDRPASVRRMCVGFDGLGVSAAAIEHYLGHGLDAIADEELSDLRGVYKSIKDGNSRREEHFVLNPDRADEQPTTPPREAAPTPNQAATELQAPVRPPNGAPF